MSKTLLQELPEGYNGNFVVTSIFEGELWAMTFQVMEGELYAYIDDKWYHQTDDLDTILRDVELVEFLIYEADEEENEEGWEEVAEAA